MTTFERLSFTPPPARTYWAVVDADGQQLKLYRTQQAAKQQLKRWPTGSSIKQA
jgi:hypothetical protein